jgi:hypothetical protein
MAAQARSTRVPWWVPFFNPIARFLLAAGDRIDIDHPVEAAEGRPVFELHPVGPEEELTP